MADPTAKTPCARAAVPRWTTSHHEHFKAGHARKVSGRSRLTDARIALGWTLAELARRSDTNINSVCALETGRMNPRHADGYAWSTVALRAADALGFTCEDLWPDLAPKVPRLPRPEAPARPDDLYDAAETSAALRAAVAELPQRHAAVIALRFGLRCGPSVLPGVAVVAEAAEAAEAAADSEGMHLPDVGAIVGVSAERARQIEMQAIAELAKAMKRAGLHV